MRTLIVYSLVSLIINYTCCQAFSQQESNDSNLGSFIEQKSLSEPIFLQRWYPPVPEAPFIPNPLSLNGSSTSASGSAPTSTIQASSNLSSSTNSNINNNTTTTATSESTSETGLSSGIIGLGSSLPLAIGSMVLSVFLSRHPSKDDIPEIIGKLENPEVLQNEGDSSNYDFKYGEEVNFNLILKSKSDDKLKSDGNILVKLPIWLEYIEGTSMINDKKLSDKADNDAITYISDDSMIIINLDKIEKDKELSFTFTTKVLTKAISEKEAFCMVKYVSQNGKSESKWQEVSIYKDISNKNNEN